MKIEERLRRLDFYGGQTSILKIFFLKNLAFKRDMEIPLVSLSNLLLILLDLTNQ